MEHEDDYDEHYGYEIVIITKITILLNVVERILIIEISLNKSSLEDDVKMIELE